MIADSHEDIRDQIIEAAREVFAKYGYRKTTIEDIASAVYKAKSSVYHYFSGKDAIFRAVIEREASQLIQSMRKAVDDEKTPVMKFRTLFKFLCEKIEETQNYYHFIKDEWYDVFHFTNEVKKKYENIITDMIISIFNEGNRQGVFDVDGLERKAKSLQVVLFGFLMPGGIIDPREASSSIDSFLDVVLSGILKRSENVL